MTAPDVPTSAADGPEVAVAAVLAPWLAQNLTHDAFMGTPDDELAEQIAAALAPLFAAERDRAVAEFAAEVVASLAHEDWCCAMGCTCRSAADFGCPGCTCLVSTLTRHLTAALRTAAAERGAAQPPTYAADVRSAVATIADDLWRVAPCGCGHRADLHTVGAMDVSVCTGGLGLCGCDWSFTRIIEHRLRAALAQPPVPLTDTAEAVD